MAARWNDHYDPDSKVRETVRERDRRRNAATWLWLFVAAVMLAGGCDTIAKMQYEMRAERNALLDGERLPDSQHGPYAGFTRPQYLQHKCDTAAGEFIYKTVDNVESVFQMRQRDPWDYLTRLKNRDIPEDPWGHTDADPFSLGGFPYNIFLLGDDKGPAWPGSASPSGA